MWSETMARQVLNLLASERRRIVAEWRILVLARRVASSEGAPLPDAPKTRQIINAWNRAHGVSLVEGVHGVYRIDVPFAAVLPVSDAQALQEAAPFAVFSHLTALSQHGLTHLIPNELHASHYGDRHGARLPLGTTPEDWIDLDLPVGTQPRQVNNVAVEWTRTKPAWDFGESVGFNAGLPIYVTDVERTLLDALRSPTKVGGLSEMLRAWRRARDALNVDKLVDYVERFDSPIIRQRVGYLLERLGLGNPRVESWRTQLRRGGSLKLAADAPYSPIYSERWNLSLNVPEAVLNELDGA